MARPTGTVTFLFTDIEGSTSAWDMHHAAMSLAQVRHDEILTSAIERENGYIFSTGGDGVAAAFQSARSAVGAAIQMQRSFESEPWPEPLRIAVRMGINTGEAIERNGDYFGPAVIKAARLMSLVGGRRIVCSSGTASLVQVQLADGIELRPVGTVRLKGLSGDEQVFAIAGPGLAEEGARLAAERSPLRDAPIATSRLIGRTAERDLALEALATHRVVTIVGMGGIGKTRLAQAIVESARDDHPDGVAWVELATAHDQDAAIHEIAGALAVRPQLGEALTVTVLNALGTRRLLLVLDNCEHLRAPVAALVAQIGSVGASATVLATSRERLGVPGERVIPLGPLDTVQADAALALLLERLDEPVNPADQPFLDVIIRQVDGIPLAIELAAARCRSLGVREVADRLTSSLRLLTDRHQVNERHRTLEQVIRWSFETLSLDEQSVFRRLSVFAGAFILEVAEQVASDDTIETLDVDDAVSALVERSLLVRSHGRFRMLEPTRQFAWAQLTEDDREQVRDRHLATMASRSLELLMGGLTADEARWEKAVSVEWADLRLAIRRAFEVDDADAAIALVVHLSAEAYFRRPEAFVWTEEAMQRYRDRPGPRRAELLAAGCQMAWTTLDIERGVALAEEALSIAPVPGQPFGFLPRAYALGAFAYAGQPQRAADLARSTLEDPTLKDPALELPPAFRVVLLATEAIALAAAVNPSAMSVARTAVAEGERAGNPSALGLALFGVAMVHQSFGGDPVEVTLALDRAKTLAESVSNQWLLGMCSNSYMSTGGIDDHHLRATAALDAMDEFLQSGWSTHAWTAGWTLPEKLFTLGHAEAAATWLGACSATAHPRLNAIIPTDLEAALTDDGDPVLQRAIATGRTLGFPELRALTRDLLSR